MSFIGSSWKKDEDHLGCTCVLCEISWISCDCFKRSVTELLISAATLLASSTRVKREKREKGKL
jgi:hypothetical protein